MAFYRVRALLGMALILGAAWLLSTDRRAVPWRVVLRGMGLQLVFALVVGAFSFQGLLDVREP